MSELEAHYRCRIRSGGFVTRRNTTLTGAAGEHYVMYRLLKLGHLAGLTPTGAKGVDILISDADGAHLAAIQVKTSGDRVCFPE
jgi:hypothetical protein